MRGALRQPRPDELKLNMTDTVPALEIRHDVAQGRFATTIGGREVNFNYLRQIAQATDQLGYFGVLIPTGRSCEDSWIVASAVAAWTVRLR